MDIFSYASYTRKSRMNFIRFAYNLYYNINFIVTTNAFYNVQFEYSNNCHLVNESLEFINSQILTVKYAPPLPRTKKHT